MRGPFIIADEAGRQGVLTHIRDLELTGKTNWEITVKRHRKRRSTKQSNLYWMWIDEITPYVSEATGYEKDEIHTIFKQSFLPAIKMEMGGLTGERRSTKDLNTQEMSQYCDRIFRWASGFGIVLPLPPERGYDGDGHAADSKSHQQDNGTDDDWQIIATDIVNLIVIARGFDRLAEIDAVYEAELTEMQKNAPGHYTRVMEARERQGEELNRKDPAADSARGEPARHTVEAG